MIRLDKTQTVIDRTELAQLRADANSWLAHEEAEKKAASKPQPRESTKSATTPPKKSPRTTFTRKPGGKQ